ncbi:BatD family protein [Psychroserpens algicola]|uniref:BatD family protein n=1 Tax=Psychroserpens algicola TaxID=1719034 RepID=UPI0019542B3F|nr:BatD family protein [Psychroserpens algicola]
MKFIKPSLMFVLLLLCSSFTNTESKLTFSTLELDNAVHFVVEVTNNHIALGQSTEVTHKLYVSQSAGISNWKNFKTPNFNGFDVENIDAKSMKVFTEKFKGETYRYVILRKSILTAKQKGEFQFEPSQLNVTIEIPSQKKDNNGLRALETVNKDFETEPFTITVK